MRRAVWALTALALFAGRAAADDTAPSNAPSGNVFTRWFAGGKKQEPKDDPKLKDTPAPKPGVTLGVARATYFERLKVCNKLREIALENGDEDLLRKAEQLEIRVWDVYQGQMSRLAGGGLSAEETVLDRRLGADPAAGRSRSTPDSSSAARR